MFEKIIKFILILLFTMLVIVLMIPKYTYITYNNLNNKIHYKNDKLPNLRIYDDNRSVNLYSLIPLEGSMVIIDNCSCKRDLVENYLNQNNRMKIIYIYVRQEGYNNDRYHNIDNVFVYRLSFFDMLMEFPVEEFREFPIVYKITKGGNIIAKDK